jgi:hypothetical protein
MDTLTAPDRLRQLAEQYFSLARAATSAEDQAFLARLGAAWLTLSDSVQSAPAAQPGFG